MPGLKVTDFRQREPKDLEAPTQPTAGYLSYDASNVYIAFVCTQPRGDIRARMQKREDLGSDDVVGVYLDTFHDRQRAYFFFSTPLGIQGDGIITETFGEDFSFDTQWDSRGKLTDDGYVVLITVPFKALRFPVKDRAGSQEWGLALVRSIRSNDEDRLLAGQHAAGERLHRPVRHRRRHRRRLARPQHPDPALRHVHRGALPRCGHRGLRARERGPRRRRREAGAARRGHPGLHHQPRLQPGRVRRAAGDGQPALRGLLPGEAAVLPRELRLLQLAADAVLLAAGAGSAVRRADDRQVREVGDGRAGDRRSRARPGGGSGEPRVRGSRRQRRRQPAPRLRQPVQPRVHGDLADLRRIGQSGRGRVDAPAPRPELVPGRAGGRQPRHRPRRRAARRRRQLRRPEPQRPRVQLLPVLHRHLARLPRAAGVRAAHRHPRRRQLLHLPLAPEERPAHQLGPELVRPGHLELRGRSAGLDRPLPGAVRVQAARRGLLPALADLGDGRRPQARPARGPDRVRVGDAAVAERGCHGVGRHAAQLLPGRGPGAFSRRFSGLADRSDGQADLAAVDRRDAPVEPARWPRRDAGRGRRHLREPHPAVAGQLSVHARVVAARHPRLRLARAEPGRRRSRAPAGISAPTSS